MLLLGNGMFPDPPLTSMHPRSHKYGVLTQAGVTSKVALIRWARVENEVFINVLHIRTPPCCDMLLYATAWNAAGTIASRFSWPTI